MSLQELLAVPEGVGHAAEVVAGLDRCFLVGFGRLGPEQNQALEALRRIGAGTPLAGPVAAAVEALGRSEFTERHFATLAAARAAIQGAQYDALRTQARTALGRPAAAVPTDVETAPAAAAATGPVAVWQESTRNWLMEVALAGFRQLEYPTLAPFTATLEHLQGEPSAARLASLLTGFLNELLASLPVSALPRIPVYRWADLWTRALIGNLRPPASSSGRKVGGTLSILGIDLHQHGYFVSFDAYGLLDSDGTTRVVRVTQSAYKVDVVCGGEVWKCFPGELEPLLRAVSDRVVLKVDGMTLLPTGDLLWDGKAITGKPFPFMDLAARTLALGVADAPEGPAVAPADRHPVQLAEPVYLADYTVSTGEVWGLDLPGDVRLPLALDRLGNSEITCDEVAKSTALFGLLRFDGGRWGVQPLAVLPRGKNAAPCYTGSRIQEYLATKKKKGDTLTILRERASRLLRQKA